MQCIGEARRRAISQAHLEHARRQLLQSYQQRSNASPLHFLLDPSHGLSPSSTPLLKPRGHPAHADVASPNDPASPVDYNPRPSYTHAGTPGTPPTAVRSTLHTHRPHPCLEDSKSCASPFLCEQSCFGSRSTRTAVFVGT